MINVLIVEDMILLRDALRYVSSAKRRSLFKSGVEVTPGDRLVTMSTCEYSFSNDRLIVVGKLVN